MDWIAIYAAVVATVLGILQILELRKRGQTRVNVSLSPLGLAGKLLFVGLDVVNHSDHPVTLTGIYLQELGASKRHVAELDVFEAERNAELYELIPPHDSATGSIPRAAVEEMGIAPGEAIVGIVETTTGFTFRSKPVVLP